MMWICYIGTSLVFLAFEIGGLVSNPLNLINPLYHLEVTFATLTQPGTWILFVIGLAGYGLISAQKSHA